MFKNLLIILILCTTFSAVNAQKREWGMEFYPKAGYLIAHRVVMGHVPEQHLIGGELSFFVQTDGRKSFHQTYNYPKIGFSIVATNLSNKVLMGNLFGSYGFVDFPFAKNERNELTGRVGIGVAAVTKVFDQHTNPKNDIMGSHVNAYISFSLKYRRYWGLNHLVTGIELSHASNGASTTPNLGVNMPYISLGYGRTFAKVARNPESIAFVKKPWKVSLIAIGSLKEVFPTGGKRYPVVALSAVANKVFKPKVGMEAGLDFIYKTSIKDYRNEKFPPKNAWDIFQMGVYCGYVLPMDKLQFVLGMGVYLKDKYNPDDLFYHRFGLKYQANKHLLLNLTLKSHWAKADYFEYGIGYTF